VQPGTRPPPGEPRQVPAVEAYRFFPAAGARREHRHPHHDHENGEQEQQPLAFDQLAASNHP
jgi:hypothetical protein